MKTCNPLATRCIPQLLVCSALAMLGPACVLTPAAASSTQTVDTAQPWRTLITQIQDGDLGAARQALSSIEATGRSERGWRERLVAAMQRREQLAQMLAERASEAVAQRQVSKAIRQIELAQWLDQAATASAGHKAVHKAQQQRDEALHRAESCAQQQAIGCLREALAQVRAIDRDNARALELELAADDWALEVPQMNTRRQSHGQPVR